MRHTMEKITTELTHAGQKISASEMKLMLNSGIPDTDFNVTQKHPLELQDITSAEDCYNLINEISDPTLLSPFKSKINLLNDLTKLVKDSLLNLGLLDTNWTWKIVKTQNGHAAQIHLEIHPDIKRKYDFFLNLTGKFSAEKKPTDQLLEGCARLFVEMLNDIKLIDQSDVEFMAAKYYLSNNNYSVILPHIDNIKLCYLEDLLSKNKKFSWLKESYSTLYTIISENNTRGKSIRIPIMQKFIKKAEEAQIPIKFSNSLLFPITKKTQFQDVSEATYDINTILIDYFNHYNISYCNANELANITYVKHNLIQAVRQRFNEKSSDPEAAQSIIIVNLDSDFTSKLTSYFYEQLTNNQTVKANISLFCTKISEAVDIVFRGKQPSITDTNINQTITKLNPYVKIESNHTIGFDNESAKNMFDNFIKHQLIIIEDVNILINASLDEKKFDWLVNWLIDKSLFNVNKPITFQP